MLCSQCFLQEAIVYLDCYCIFCPSCFEKRKPELELAMKSLNNQACPFCGRKTLFKRCDARVPSEASTIKELTLAPRKASLRAAETIEFYLLQSKKQIAFLEKKNSIYERILDKFVQYTRPVNFEFLNSIREEDQFGIVKNFIEKHQSFTMDSIKPSIFELQSQIPIQQRKKISEEPKRRIIEEAPIQRSFQQNELRQRSPNYSREDFSIGHQTHNKFGEPQQPNRNLRNPNDESKQLNFNFRSIKRSNFEKGSSNRQTKYNLQNQLMDNGALLTPRNYDY